MKQKSQSGFLLIEVAVGILILSIAFVGLYNMFTYGVELMAEQEYKLIAMSIVQEKMAVLKNIADNNTRIPSSEERAERVLIDANSPEVQDDIWGWLVIDIEYEEGPGGKLYYNIVNVALTWTGPSGRDYIMQMRTFLQSPEA